MRYTQSLTCYVAVHYGRGSPTVLGRQLQALTRSGVTQRPAARSAAAEPRAPTPTTRERERHGERKQGEARATPLGCGGCGSGDGNGSALTLRPAAPRRGWARAPDECAPANAVCERPPARARGAAWPAAAHLLRPGIGQHDELPGALQATRSERSQCVISKARRSQCEGREQSECQQVEAIGWESSVALAHELPSLC